MTLVLDESEDISWGLLSPLLASVRKENQVIFLFVTLLFFVFFVVSWRQLIQFTHHDRKYYLLHGS